MRDLYQQCPDCGGIGYRSYPDMDGDETQVECERCHGTNGYVKVEPTEHRMLWCFTHNEEVQFGSHAASVGMCTFSWRRKEYRRIEGVPCDVGRACVVQVEVSDV